MTEKQNSILVNRFLKSQTDSTLIQNLRRLEVIKAFEKGEFDLGSKKHIFDAMVKKICKEEPNINDVSEEWIGERFGIDSNDEQRSMLNAIYYAIGKSKDPNLISLADMERWSDCIMRSAFFDALDFSPDDIRRLIRELKNNPKEALKHVHYCGYRHNDGKSLLNVKSQPFDAEYLEFLVKDCNYILLPESIYLLGEYCLRERAYDLWIDLLMALPNIELRSALIGGIHTVGELRNVYCEIGKRPYSNKKLKYIIRSRFMDLLVSETLNLIGNAENKSLEKRWQEACKEIKRDFDKNYEGWIVSMTKDWRRVFSFNEMSVWLNKQENEIVNRRLRSNEIKSRYIEIIRKQLAYRQYESKINYEDFTANELISLSALVVNKNYKEEFYEGLSKRICERLYIDRPLPIIEISNEGFTLMRNIYKCLKKGKVDGIELFKQYRRPDEGFTATLHGIDTHRADSLWLGILTLQLENEKDTKKIEVIEDLLFSYSRIEGDSDNYFLPFYMLELIMCQNVKKLKDKFEERLLIEVSSLVFVIRVLTANGGDLSESNRKKLAIRVKNEWKIEKEIYFNKNYANLFKILDEYIISVKIPLI